MSKNTDESVELETCLFKPRKQAVVYKFLIANVYSKMALRSNETLPAASQLPLLFKYSIIRYKSINSGIVSMQYQKINVIVSA